MKSYIYFIQEGLQGNIKIGISQDPNERIKQHQTSNSNPLRTLLVKEGTTKDEEELHKKFNKFQTKGEWFKPSEEILVFVEQEKEKIKNEKIVELETKVEHLTTKIDNVDVLQEMIKNTEIIIELEDKVEHLTTEIDNLRNQFNRPIVYHPNDQTPYNRVCIQKIDSIQTDENKKRITHIRFMGTCDIDLNSQRNGINLEWEVDDDEYEFMLLSKIFDFDKIILKNKNSNHETPTGIKFNDETILNDFFREESNKDSIFDFISSKTFPYMRNCILIGPFHGEYNREENLTYLTPKEVIILGN